ncbi:hypothetical protein E2C01_015066 [Portunus trituberculatus]|uniref:Uncharacterized protein n=1 Tax=Portunus trituberculatus TaxID=210409 RepID=A0A5B7DKP3_PORTR|nr:hypothetical protein [Portunus trituberculatus]
MNICQLTELPFGVVLFVFGSRAGLLPSPSCLPGSGGSSAGIVTRGSGPAGARGPSTVDLLSPRKSSTRRQLPRVQKASALAALTAHRDASRNCDY